VPLGLAFPEIGETVAVNVMLVPITPFVDEADIAVDVPTVIGVTVTPTADDVLPEKLASPG